MILDNILGETLLRTVGLTGWSESWQVQASKRAEAARFLALTSPTSSRFRDAVSTLFFNINMPRSNSPGEGQQPPVPRATSPSRDRESRHDRKRHHHAHRSRSPRRDADGHRHKRHRSRSPKAKPVILPYKAQPLSKRHYDDYKPLFQSYLDIQKNIQLDDLDEREAKGRWKSFTSRWYAFSAPPLSSLELKNTNVAGIVET
jgi:hypothetical protein